MWMVRERCETLLDVETLYIPYSVSIFAKSTILWLDNEAISGTLVAIFGPILSLGYMSLFKYLYQRYETHPILKVWKMPAKYLLPFTLVKVSLVHSSSIVTV